MGKTPRIALASVFLAGLGLTGCESCGLFGANKPWRQDQVAATPSAGANTATSGWQNRPRSATAGLPDTTAKTTTLGQSNLDAGFGARTTAPASGFSGMNATPNTAFGQNGAIPASGNLNAFGQNPGGTTGNSVGQSTGVSRTTFPQPSTATDWNRDANVSVSQPSVSSGDRTPTFPGTSSPSVVSAPSGSPTSSFPGQGNGTSNAQYQTQYPNTPSSDSVKTMPPPGQGDQ